jgi:hypothetical protein
MRVFLWAIAHRLQILCYIKSRLKILVGVVEGLLLGLTQALRILGVLGFLAVTQIKLSDNFCVSPVLLGAINRI